MSLAGSSCTSFAPERCIVAKISGQYLQETATNTVTLDSDPTGNFDAILSKAETRSSSDIDANATLSA